MIHTVHGPGTIPVGERDIREPRIGAISTAVAAAGTSLTGLSGVGPVIAAVIGDVRDVSRFPGRDHFALTTGPRRSGCPPDCARSTG